MSSEGIFFEGDMLHIPIDKGKLFCGSIAYSEECVVVLVLFFLQQYHTFFWYLLFCYYS